MLEIDLPLLSLPKDVKMDDGILKGIDGTYRYWRLWDDAGGAERKGVIVLQHGYSEHTARYFHVATLLVRLGYVVFGIDAYGHGRSDGERGNIDEWDTYVHEFELGVQFVQGLFPDLPYFFLGHSNGGLTVIRHSLLYPNRAQKYCVTSPFCAPKYSHPRYLWYASKLLASTVPGFKIHAKNVTESVSTHVEAVNIMQRKDPFGFNYMRAGWLFESLQVQADLLSRADQISDPFLVFTAGEDMLADESRTRKVFAKLGSREKEYQLYPGLYHGILSEKCWEEVVLRIDRWFIRP